MPPADPPAETEKEKKKREKRERKAARKQAEAAAPASAMNGLCSGAEAAGFSSAHRAVGILGRGRRGESVKVIKIYLE